MQETRDLLQGTITARTSQVANVLGITNDDVAQYKGNIDGLFTFLQSKFNAYSQAMKAYTNTLPGSIEQLQESVGIAGQTVIDNFAPSITAVAQYITSLLGTWQDANGTIIDSNGKVTDSMGNVYDSIDKANEAGIKFDETTTSFQPSDTLNEFIEMLSDIADFLVLCVDEVYNWAVANGYIDDQTPIFETLGTLIMACLAYVTDVTLAVIDFGTTFAKVGRQIFNTVLNPLLTGLEQLYSHIVQIINGLASMAEAGNAAIHGDFEKASAIKANAEAYAENERKYRDRIGDEAYTRITNPDTPLFGGSSGYGDYRTSSYFSKMLEEANTRGKFTRLKDWAEEAKKSGINPSAIRGMARPDDKDAKKAAKEALQEAKRYYNEQKEALKNALEDIKDNIKKQIESLDTMFSQGLLTVTDYYKQKESLEASQSQADVDYYKQLIALTEATPYEHETDRQKELLKLERELSKATSKLDDINKTQGYIADLTDYNNKLVEQQNTQSGGKQQIAGTTSVPQGATPEEAVEYTMSKKYNVPLDLILAIAMQESGNKQWGGAGGTLTTSPAGAQGVMQLMPDTFESLGFTDISNMNQNVEAGVAYIRQLLDTFNNNTTNVVAGYNAGAGAIQKYGGVPPYAETQDYVSSVLSKMQGEALDRATQLNNSTLQEVADNTSKMTTSADSYDSLLADISKNIYYNNVTSHDQEEQITGCSKIWWSTTIR